MANLTARGVAAAGPGKYADGRGLTLRVTPSGSKRWTVKVSVRGKSVELGLGSWPEVSLADAREKAGEYRALARRGIDPRSARATPTGTFGEAAESWIEAHAPEWTPRTGRSRLSALRRRVASLWEVPVGQITPEAAVRALRASWGKPSGEKLRALCSRVMLAQVAAGNVDRDPFDARLLRHFLPRVGAIHQTTHHEAPDWRELGAMLGRLPESVPGLAVRFLALTATRSNEVRLMGWEDLQDDWKTWVIPPQKTKARRAHRVPLPEAAQAILRAVPKAAPYCFAGRGEGAPLGQDTALRAWKAVGGATLHGLRSAFRDWAAETGEEHTLAELSLGHAGGDVTIRSYRRSDLLEQRRDLLNRWAEVIRKA